MNRLFLAGCVLTLLLTSRAKPSTLSCQPNIVLFVVDDLGWSDTSVQFHDQCTAWNSIYDTPNLERLANRGMKFTNAYSASPVYSPTRVSLITGLNPGRSHITDWVRETGDMGNSNRYLRSSKWRSRGLQPGDKTTTSPEVLRGSLFILPLRSPTYRWY